MQEALKDFSESNSDNKEKESSDAWLDIYIEILLQFYQPEPDQFHETAIRATTKDLFERLRPTFPFDDFTAPRLFLALKNGGFKLANPTGLSPEWILRPIK